MNRPLARLTVLAAAATLAACGTFDGSSDKIDYRAPVAKSKPLDVPPDLTQLSRENRYAQQGGVVSAAGAPGAAASQPAGQTVAPDTVGSFKVVRDGAQRWLVTTMAPEQLYPLIKTFWTERGFAIAVDSPEAGVIETDWAENRAKLPQDALRGGIAKFFSGLYDSGERDRFRTRIERTATGSEVTITHRGLQEVYNTEQREGTSWQARPGDPELEAEFLSRLMVRLGTPEAAARATVASAPEVATRARSIAGAAAALEVDEPFERAWRRVGLALDRGGFTVEDRDRASGLYFVRYIDPKAAENEPGFWTRLFTADKDLPPKGPLRYRISVKGSGEKTVVSVLSSAGAPESSDNARRIVGQLVNELR